MRSIWTDAETREHKVVSPITRPVIDWSKRGGALIAVCAADAQSLHDQRERR